PSLDYSYLPVARHWADWVAENLDSGTDKSLSTPAPGSVFRCGGRHLRQGGFCGSQCRQH
ncbi:MAG: hypothetical protein ACREFY_09965, partial [Acetobacteraceae bacterium]